MIFFLFDVEERSLQRIFSPNRGAKQTKTPHEALMNHRLTTIIYFGTDNTKSADILPVLVKLRKWGRFVDPIDVATLMELEKSRRIIVHLGDVEICTKKTHKGRENMPRSQWPFT